MRYLHSDQWFLYTVSANRVEPRTVVVDVHVIIPVDTVRTGHHHGVFTPHVGAPIEILARHVLGDGVASIGVLARYVCRGKLNGSVPSTPHRRSSHPSFVYWFAPPQQKLQRFFPQKQCISCFWVACHILLVFLSLCAITVSGWFPVILPLISSLSLSLSRPGSRRLAFVCHGREYFPLVGSLLVRRSIGVDHCGISRSSLIYRVSRHSLSVATHVGEAQELRMILHHTTIEENHIRRFSSSK